MEIYIVIAWEAHGGEIYSMWSNEENAWREVGRLMSDNITHHRSVGNFTVDKYEINTNHASNPSYWIA